MGPPIFLRTNTFLVAKWFWDTQMLSVKPPAKQVLIFHMDECCMDKFQSDNKSMCKIPDLWHTSFWLIFLWQGKNKVLRPSLRFDNILMEVLKSVTTLFGCGRSFLVMINIFWVLNFVWRVLSHLGFGLVYLKKLCHHRPKKFLWKFCQAQLQLKLIF